MLIALGNRHGSPRHSFESPMHSRSPRPHTTAPAMGRVATRRGMTLIEVMIAMFVLLIVFGGALQSIVHVSRMVATAKNRTRAVAIVNQKMEEMRALNFTTLSTNLSLTTFTSGTIPMSGNTGGLSTDSFSDSKRKSFRWTRISDTSGADVSSSLLKVVVRVEWDDRTVTSAVSAYSYFSQNGVLPSSS
jgi:prepilin-type N-terminal cleavage/methylation domain-containing protein